MSVLTRKVISPPYCGVPNLSHQCPAAVVVVGAVVLAAVVVVLVVVVLVVVVVFVVVEVEDAVFVVQDAKTRDVTIRQVSNIQVIPLFMQTSFYFWNTSGKLNVYFFQNILIILSFVNAITDISCL
jgi:hypothetical protein